MQKIAEGGSSVAIGSDQYKANPLKYSLFKDVVYGRSFTKELEAKTEELEMKHNRLAGLFKTGFIKETKPVMGDIKSSLEKASKIAQIQKLQREIEAKKRDDQMKVIARKPKPLPKPRPQKRKVDDEAEKPKPKKQPKLDFFFKKK